MRKTTASSASSPSDREIRGSLRALWKRMGLLAIHCGGQGLVVGCPVCGRRFPV